MPRPPLPIFACLLVGFLGGLKRLAEWLTTDADAALVAVLVVLTGVMLVLTKGGRRLA
jgi:hypothetical protein